jgi:glycosyltransferase involved in cell wall biosynthesis
MPENQTMDAPAGVDVAVPCYQYGRYLRDCVRSVLIQGYRKVRVLIIDNASTDDSLEVAQQLASEDRRVEVVAHRTNLGQHASYNEAIDWASSKYFVILCADDVLMPGCLARTVAIMEQHPDVGFAYGHAIPLRAQDPLPVFATDPAEAPWRIVAGEDLIRQLCRQAAYLPPGSSALLFRTAIQKAAGYYRPELPHTDDLEMCLRLARLGRVAETKAPLAIVRAHGSNRSAFARDDYSQNVLRFERDPTFFVWHEEDEAAFESFFAHEGRSLPEAARLHRLARRSLGERAYWSALAHLCRGQPGASLELFKFASRRCPTAAILPPVSLLFRRPGTVGKLIWVASEVARWASAPAKPAPVGE